MHKTWWVSWKKKGNIEPCAKELAGAAGSKSTLHLTEKRLYNERCLVYSRDVWNRRVVEDRRDRQQEPDPVRLSRPLQGHWLLLTAAAFLMEHSKSWSICCLSILAWKCNSKVNRANEFHDWSYIPLWSWQCVFMHIHLLNSPKSLG